MTNPNQNERSRLFHDIGVIDFVIVEKIGRAHV